MGVGFRNVFLVSILAAGCGESNTAPRCVPGATNSCLCVGAGNGVQMCAADGTYGMCMCAAPGTDAGTDGAVPGDAPGNVAVPPDNASPADATTPLDGSPPVDAPPGDATPGMDATPPPPDMPAPTDTAAPDAPPVVDVPAPSDASAPDGAPPPDAAGACSSLPTGPVGARMLDPLTLQSSEETAIGFTPAGLLAVGRSSASSGGLRVITSDGFARSFTMVSVGPVADVRFQSDMQAVIAPSRSGDVHFSIVDPTRRIRTVSMLLSTPRIALDREGGIYYTSGDQLFRTTASGIGPGEFLTSGLSSAIAMVINADRSALFFLRLSTPSGFFRVALRTEGGSVFASDPALYFPIAAVGNPVGLAIDVCGNLYTADTRANILWRIPTGPTPAMAGPRPTALYGGQVGAPVYGAGPFDPTRLYWINGARVYSVPTGVMGFRQ